MKSIYVFDLDGTLANCDHRQEFALNKDWETFHSLCELDSVYPGIQKLFQDLAELASEGFSEGCIRYEVIIITGRDEAYRKQTEIWLHRNGLYPDRLIMRPTGDRRKDSEFKIEVLKDYLGDGIDPQDRVIAWFEDRDQLVEDLRNAGFTVLQTKAGAY